MVLLKNKTLEIFLIFIKGIAGKTHVLPLLQLHFIYYLFTKHFILK